MRCKNHLLVLAGAVALAGCVEQTAGDIPPDVPVSPPDSLPVSDMSWIGEELLGSYYVTSFSASAVQAVREMPSFLGSAVQAIFTISGHPVYDRQTAIDYHPYAATRLDYALSTGLTGAGQVLSLLDDGVRISHEQFSGKTITVTGTGTGSDESHGTPVAGVMVGNGQGPHIGYAPGADLHVGRLDYRSGLNWNSIAALMDGATASGAIASNNSWGLNRKTVASPDAASIAAGMGPYISAVRRFGEQGVVVFAVQNDYHDTSVEFMAGLPQFFPDLEPFWLAVVNAIPDYDNERIRSAVRMSAPCAEAARYCLTAPGLVSSPTHVADDAYGFHNGSSFAAPQVTGSIALLAEAFPHLSPEALRARLLVTADNRFFTPEGVVDFGSGLTHGYNSEFGHGFIDLRAALLPIGTIGTPTPSGERIALGTPSVISGGAAGDAILKSLSSIDVVALDDMQGVFRLNGAAMGATAAHIMPALSLMPAGRSLSHDLSLRGRGSADEAALRQMLGRDGAAFLSGAENLSFPVSEGLSLSLIQKGGKTVGTGFRSRIGTDAGEFSFGVSSLSVEGSVLGVSVPGFESRLRSHTESFEIGWGADFGGLRLDLEAGFGVSSAGGAGSVAAFSNMSHNRIGAALGISDVIRRNDHLTLFARQPVAFSSGQAEMVLPVGFSADGVIHENVGLDLAPVARQIDIGFEYLAPLSSHATMSFSAAWTGNAGHMAGISAVTVGLGVQMRF